MGEQEFREVASGWGKRKGPPETGQEGLGQVSERRAGRGGARGDPSSTSDACCVIRLNWKEGRVWAGSCGRGLV